jgi:putative methyltransferase (TIGR04325 family)
MKHAYCAYCDENYLPRVLLMLRSLRSFDAETPVLVLPLSGLCEIVLRDFAPPGVVILPHRRLEAEFPELSRLKRERTAIEYIFTVKPFLLLYAFAEIAAESLTYVDGDLYFYGDPRGVLASIGTASIALTPHRFAPDREADIRYGQFNAGWVTIRRNAEGLACLRRWADDCASWCHDRVDNGRFGDQGYLDAWPGRYPSLAIIDHKGVNLALWNVDNHILDERGGAVTVDGEGLIAYHFHGIRLQPDRSFAIWYPHRSGGAGSVLRRRLYNPYLARLIDLRIDLHARFPALAEAERPLRYIEPDVTPKSASAWRHCGEEWSPAGLDMRCDDAVSRNLVAALAIARHGDADDAALATALVAGAGSRRRIRVLDWGGGVGIARTAAAKAAPGLALDWHVVDTRSRCEHGAAIQPQVRFLTDAESLGKQRFDLVHAGGSIGADPDWRGTLARLRRFCSRALLLDHVAVSESEPSFVAEYHDASWPEGTVFTSWILNEAELWAALAAAGFTLEQRWAPDRFDPILGVAGRYQCVSLLCSVPLPSLITPIGRTG